MLQSAAIDPTQVADRLSAAYLIVVKCVDRVRGRSNYQQRGPLEHVLPTLTVDTVIGFGSPEDRAVFATDLQSRGRRAGCPVPPRRRATAPPDHLVLSPTQGALDEHSRPTRPTYCVEHRMERTFEVAATPEQVWNAIATAEGISAWMVPTRLDPRIGGEVSFDLGEFRSNGVVTDYTPNVRFAYEEPWPIAEHVEDVPAAMVEWFATIGVPLSDVYRDLPSVTPIATEFLIEAASGGSCVIRVVTSAYGSGADWENEFFAEMVAGWARSSTTSPCIRRGGPRG